MSSSKRVFGQATRQGPTRYQRQLGGSSKGNASSSHSADQLTEEQERAERRLKMKLKRRAEDEACDERFGYCRYSHNTGDGSRSKRGWVFNILPTVRAGFSASFVFMSCDASEFQFVLTLSFLFLDGRVHIYHIPYTIYHIPYTIYHIPYTIL